MEIRKIGPLPEDNFLIMPNVSIRDRRLSYRARGLMAVISSHNTGFHISSDELAEGGLEGIKAIRTAMNELVAHDYMRRVRSQDAEGKWRTDIDVYIWGDAPPARQDNVTDADLTDETPTDEPFPPVGEPPTQNRQAEMVHVGEDHLENNSYVAVGSLVTDEDITTTEVALERQILIETGRNPRRDRRPLPVVYQRLLAERHNVSTPEQREAWSSAWDRAEDIRGSVEFEPYDHLAKFLTGCTEGQHKAVAQRWLGFFIQDRAEFIARSREAEERRLRNEETPQEREDRLNRRLPPVWPEEPVGSARKAATTGEQA